eukprot:4510654-Ditylum_brightwellii.AAC.1
MKNCAPYPKIYQRRAFGSTNRGVLHPEGLLFTLNPLKEVIAIGPSSTGWLRRSHTASKLADAYNLPSWAKIDNTPIMTFNDMVMGLVPAKVVDAVLEAFTFKELEGVGASDLTIK